MILKSHQCGVAVVYEDSPKIKSDTRNTFFAPVTGRVQGSLYSQQKRKIADACEYMRKNAVHKPIIFVATSPGYTDLASERQLISKLTHNLRNGYSCKNYVWVREFTGAGYPHFHFVADMPDFYAPDLSLYWSRLFGSDALNSIRVGTAPRCSKCKSKLKAKGQPCYKSGCTGIGTVKKYLDNKQMAFYISKYIGKSIGGLETMALDAMKKKSFRTFAVSRELGQLSKPELYTGKMIRTGEKLAFTVRGTYEAMQVDERQWSNENNTLTDYDLQKNWNWRYTGFSSTFKGFPKSWKLKK